MRAARIAAAEGGAKVALAEEIRMGGTCVIRGCVPKKLMVYRLGIPRHDRRCAAPMAGSVTAGAFDWDVFHTKLEAELDAAGSGLSQHAEECGRHHP